MKDVIWLATCSQFVLGIELLKNCGNLGTSFPDRSGKGMDIFYLLKKERKSWFTWMVRLDCSELGECIP